MLLPKYQEIILPKDYPNPDPNNTEPEEYSYEQPYPPLGFIPLYEYGLGNGDYFGLYWPIGKENQPPIVAEMWHDEGSIKPFYSSIPPFIKRLEKWDQDADDEEEEDSIFNPTTFKHDENSPTACFEAAEECISQRQDFDSAIIYLEKSIAILPEYTEALVLLWKCYKKNNLIEKAILTGLQAIISPPCFGLADQSIVAWLNKQNNSEFAANPLIQNDPIWQAKADIHLKFGDTKENPIFPILLNAINIYIQQENWIKAVTLMQNYAEYMFYETVSFQQRYDFKIEKFTQWQIEISKKLPFGSRNKVEYVEII